MFLVTASVLYYMCGCALVGVCVQCHAHVCMCVKGPIADVY